MRIVLHRRWWRYWWRSEQRDRRHELEDVLHYDLVVGLRIRGSHDSVDPRVECARFVPSARSRSYHWRNRSATAVPQAANVRSTDDLHQSALVDVSDFDEP